MHTLDGKKEKRSIIIDPNKLENMDNLEITKQKSGDK